MDRTATNRRPSRPRTTDRRGRSRLVPGLLALEARQLLTSSLVVPTAQSQTLTFPNIETNPNLTGQFLKFQPLAGTLTAIDINYSGSVGADFSAENLSGSPSTITGTTRGAYSATGPNGTVLTTMAPITESFNASAFDGTLDDAGTSGKDFGPATATAPTQTVTLTSASDLAPFIGAGTVPITVAGKTASVASGTGGNLASGFTAHTNATISVVYHFLASSGGGTPVTPPTVDPPLGNSPTAPDDFLGNGRTDLAVFRPSTAQWFIAGQAQPVGFGAGNLFDIPIPADYDGTGHAQLAVFRPSTAQWFIGGHAQPASFGAGNLFDIPVPADYDGTGHAQLAVFRPSTAQWFIGGQAQPVGFGAGNLFDIPVPGDYDGTGHAQLAVFRPSTGQWFIGGHAQPITFGSPNLVDIPVPGDYDGTGHDELAVFRPSTGQWFIQGHAQPISFGAGNLFDFPVETSIASLMKLESAAVPMATSQGSRSFTPTAAPATVSEADVVVRPAPTAATPAVTHRSHKGHPHHAAWLAALERLDRDRD